jgi:hypothetical protein
MQSTQITLYDAQGILSNLMDEQEKITKCDICETKINGDCYSICRTFLGDQEPVQYKSSHERDKAEEMKKRHQGHICCQTCCDDQEYIGDKGKCKACEVVFGGGRRNPIIGYALIPPVKCAKTTELIKLVRDAEQQIDEKKSVVDDARIQEGARRRAAAVEEKKKKEAEREVEREALIVKMKEDEEKAKAQREAERVEMKKTMDNAKQEKERAEAEKVRMQDEKAQAEAETVRIQMEADAHKQSVDEELRIARELALSPSRDLPLPSVSPKKRKRVVSEESLQKRRQTAEMKANKLKDYDTMAEEFEVIKGRMITAEFFMKTVIDGFRAENDDTTRDFAGHAFQKYLGDMFDHYFSTPGVAEL